jgi:hypothetical protein
MSFYHFYFKKTERDTEVYNKEFFPFIQELKPNYEDDDEIENCIDKYHEYVTRKEKKSFKKKIKKKLNNSEN